MLDIYHVAGTRSLRVIWLCEELGLAYRPIPVDFSAAYRATPAWRALNPVGKVPVMKDGELTLFESGAMVQYLVDRYGDGRLQPPPGTPEHARYLQWSWFAESTFARPLGEMVNHRREFPDAEVPAVLEEMARRTELCLHAVADATAEGPYLLGDAFSAADVMMGYSLFLSEHLIPDRLPDGVLPYWQRLAARPAFQRARAVP
ncbi:MAG: glutathione S-transferase family protein [Pseudomonadales bacterium]